MSNSMFGGLLAIAQRLFASPFSFNHWRGSRPVPGTPVASFNYWRGGRPLRIGRR